MRCGEPSSMRRTLATVGSVCLLILQRRDDLAQPCPPGRMVMNRPARGCYTRAGRFILPTRERGYCSPLPPLELTVTALFASMVNVPTAS